MLIRRKSYARDALEQMGFRCGHHRIEELGSAYFAHQSSSWMVFTTAAGAM